MDTEQALSSNLEGFSWCLEQTQDENAQYPNKIMDLALEEKIRRAIWKDDVLRATDFNEINIRVKNGVAYTSGHLLNSTNRQRVEKAIHSIEGLRGTQSSLVMDDELTCEVAAALASLEMINHCKFFTGVSHGVVVLNGKVESTELRLDAELCAASHPHVRGVINYISVPGITFSLDDNRLLQPPIGKEIYFLDGISGIVNQVVINPNNRRVDAMTIKGRFYNLRPSLSISKNWPAQTAEQLLLIPMNIMGYLTNSSGYLTVASTNYAKFEKFEPALFTAPHKGWVPPYPYCPMDVLFQVKEQDGVGLQLSSNDSLGG